MYLIIHRNIYKERYQSLLNLKSRRVLWFFESSSKYSTGCMIPTISIDHLHYVKDLFKLRLPNVEGLVLIDLSAADKKTKRFLKDVFPLSLKTLVFKSDAGIPKSIQPNLSALIKAVQRTTHRLIVENFEIKISEFIKIWVSARHLKTSLQFRRCRFSFPACSNFKKSPVLIQFESMEFQNCKFMYGDQNETKAVSNLVVSFPEAQSISKIVIQIRTSKSGNIILI